MKIAAPTIALLVLLPIQSVWAQDSSDNAGPEITIEAPNFIEGTRTIDPCEAVDEGALFKPLAEIRTVLVDDGKRMPPDCSNQFFTEELAGDAPRFTVQSQFHWEPTNFFHMPTYFDDVPLERYGQHYHERLQPFISGARFVLQLPVLPYKMGVDRPHACITTLGHRPPGDCVPCIRQRLPLEADAALLQAAATVGLAFVLP